MKKYLILLVVLTAVIVIITAQYNKINSLKSERDTYKRNTTTLLQDVETYKTKDSLNAARVSVLELKLSDYQKYRAEDLKLIKTLKSKNQQLERVTNMQSVTINELKGSVRDSLIYVDKVVTDTLYCVDIVNKWYELHGCANKNLEFSGTFITFDSIIVAMSIEYKRFLGFLWHTNKIKNMEVNVLSKNPNTKILNVEYTIIKK